MDLDHIGVVDDAVTDSVCKGWIIQILMPARDIHLGAEDSGRRLGPGFDQFQYIPRFAFLERIEQPFIQDKQLNLLELLHVLPVGAFAAGNGDLHEQIRQPDITDSVEAPAGGHAERTGDIGLASSGGAEKNDVV